jgi:16S rRNA processing protein RimM
MSAGGASRAGRTQGNAAGSQSSGEPAFLAVGKLRRPHGVRGEIIMEIYTDFPERLVPGMLLYLGEQQEPVRLAKTRQHREGLLATFEGYTTPEEVAQLRNQVVFVRTEDSPPLAQGEYYHHQLVGLRVVTPEGETVGTVLEILETGASDVLVVRQVKGPDVLIPMVDAFVRQVDLAGGEIMVQLIPGMRGEEG